MRLDSAVDHWLRMGTRLSHVLPVINFALCNSRDALVFLLPSPSRPIIIMPKSQPQRKVLCACGCGQQVTHATQRNHLQGKGKMALRARIFAEHQLLQPSTSQQPQMSSKPSNSTSGRNLRWTRRKTAQVEMEGEPEISQVDAESMEPLSDPVSDQLSHLDADAMPNLDGNPREALPHSTDRMERVVQQRWGNNSLQDEDSEDGNSEDDDPEVNDSEDSNLEGDNLEDDNHEDGNSDGILDGENDNEHDLYIPGEVLEREMALEGSFVLY